MQMTGWVRWMQTIGWGRPWRKQSKGQNAFGLNQTNSQSFSAPHPQSATLCHNTHNSHIWCVGSTTALNVVTTSDLGVWRRVPQAHCAAAAQLLVNYLVQQAESLSAPQAKEEDKACLPLRRVCVSSGRLGLVWNICHIPLGFGDLSDTSTCPTTPPP